MKLILLLFMEFISIYNIYFEFPYQITLLFILNILLFFYFIKENKKNMMIINWYIFILLIALFVLIPYDFYINYEINPGRSYYYQSYNSSLLLANIISLFISSCYIFSYFINQLLKKTVNFPFNKDSELSIFTWIIVSFFSIILSWYYHPSESILSKAYGEAEYGNLGVGVIEAIYGILLLILYVDILFYYNKIKLYIFIMTFLLSVIWFAFLRGARVEGLGLILSIFLLTFRLASYEEYIKYYENVMAKFIRYAAYTIPILILTLMFLGMARADVNGIFTPSELLEMLISYFSDLTNFTSVFFGTWMDVDYVGMIVIHQLHENAIPYLYGQSYIDMLLATVPKSLWINRPLSPSEMIASEFSIGGGIILPATAFWNGGYIGVVIISFIYSSIFLRISSNVSSTFKVLLFGLCIMVSLRLVLYSEWSFYKYFIVFIFDYYFVKIINSITRCIK